MKQALQNHIIQFGVTFFWFLFWSMYTLNNFYEESASLIFESATWTTGISTLIALLGLSATVFFLGSLVTLCLKQKIRSSELFFWGTVIGFSAVSILVFGFAELGNPSDLLQASVFWMMIIVSWGAYEFFSRTK